MWTRSLALASGLALAIWGDPAFAQAALDREALLAHGFEIASFKPADAFSGPPDESALAGQPFHLTKPLEESEEPRLTHIIGGWSYDRQTQTLRIGISTAGWQRTQLPDAEAEEFMHYGLRAGTRNLSDQMTMAQNAYGAQFEVHSIEAQAVQVAPLTRRERAASVDIPSNMYADVQMVPEEARAAVAGAEVVVEGVLAAVAPGRITLCYDSGSSATINLRLSTLTHTCVMNARITRVAVVAADGRTLTEWTAAGAR
tara:strand:+ start:49374 stop:50144 length:771 start_codon:yes stop_codon:yes gene_type:complete